MPERLRIVCREPAALGDGRVLVGKLRLATEQERVDGYYMEEDVVIPGDIRQPTDDELAALVAHPNDRGALRLFAPGKQFRSQVLALHKDHMYPVDGQPADPHLGLIQLPLAANILGAFTIISAGPNELSTTLNPKFDMRRTGMHPDMWPRPTYASGLCLEGTRYIVVGDVGLNDVDRRHQWVDVRDPEAKALRRAAYCDVVRNSVEDRNCMLVRIDEGEMYSGLKVAEDMHDGSSVGLAASRLALIMTSEPLPRDLYPSVL